MNEWEASWTSFINFFIKFYSACSCEACILIGKSSLFVFLGNISSNSNGIFLIVEKHTLVYFFPVDLVMPIWCLQFIEDGNV